VEEERRTSKPIVPFGTGEFPQKPEEVTANWINAVFQQDRLPQIDEVVSIELQSKRDGYGLVGILSGVKLNYRKSTSDAPQYLMAKFSSDSEISQFSSKREVLFYRDVAPQLKLRTPICYFAGTSQTDRSALLLEYFSEGSCGDSLNGCTLEQAELVFISAAELHGQWWDSPALQQWDWLGSRNKASVNELQAVLRKSWPGFREEYGSMIPDWASKIAVKGIDRVSELISKRAEGPITLVHGDMQLDNVWFGHRDVPVILFDWAGTMRAHGAEDIAHFLSDSYPVDQRRETEDRLLNTYIEKLRSFGIVLPLPVLREHIAARILLTLITTPLSVANRDFSKERTKIQFHSSLERCMAMWEDYPVGDVL
jgi:hypothetical protein